MWQTIIDRIEKETEFSYSACVQFSLRHQHTPLCDLFFHISLHRKSDVKKFTPTWWLPHGSGSFHTAGSCRGTQRDSAHTAGPAGTHVDSSRGQTHCTQTDWAVGMESTRHDQKVDQVTQPVELYQICTTVIPSHALEKNDIVVLKAILLFWNTT